MQMHGTERGRLVSRGTFQVSVQCPMVEGDVESTGILANKELGIDR